MQAQGADPTREVPTSSQGIATETFTEMTVFSRPKGPWQTLMPVSLLHPPPVSAEATRLQQNSTTVSSPDGRPSSSLVPPFLAMSSDKLSSSPGQCHPLHNGSSTPPLPPQHGPWLDLNVSRNLQRQEQGTHQHSLLARCISSDTWSRTVSAGPCPLCGLIPTPAGPSSLSRSICCFHDTLGWGANFNEQD